MDVNWDVWDLVDEFHVYQAGCLWLEIEPNHVTAYNDEHVKVVISEIEKNTGGRVPEHGRVLYLNVEKTWSRSTGAKVTRNELKQMAESKGKKPKFLFPEEREKQPTQLGSKDKQSDERQLNSYRIILLAALEELESLSKKRYSAADFGELIEKTEYSLDIKTIRGILNSLRDISERRKRE